MATLYAKAAGGNWNAASTWSNVSPLGVDNSGPPVSGDSIVFTAASGNVVVNVGTASLRSFDMTGYLGTLSGTGTISVVGAASTTQDVIFDGTITWTGGLTLAPTSITANIRLTTNGKLLTSVFLNGQNGSVTLLDNFSFAAIKTASFVMQNNVQFNMNGFAISGNSATNRVLVGSAILGTARKFSLNGGSSGSSAQFANADFRDIALDNGGSDLDLSAITGLSGDCGGNGMSGGGTLTLTSPTTNYWVGDAGAWDDVNEWASSSGGTGGTGRVPLPQDDATFDTNSFSANGQNVTTDMPRLAKNIDFSGTTETGSLNSTAATSVYGSVNMGPRAWTGNVNKTFEGRGNSTLTTGGLTLTANNFFISMYGGTLTLLDALTLSNSFSNQLGAFDANDFTVTAASFSMANAATVYAGNGTWIATGNGTPWSLGASTTWDAEGSTIVLTNTAASNKNFNASGRTYYNVTFSGDNITVLGSNTFNGTFAVNNAGLTNGLKITSGTTQTLNGGFATNGSSGSLAKLLSTTAGSAATLTKSSGTISVDYMSIKDSTATGGAAWYAGANSTNVSGNTGWIFSTLSSAVASAIGSCIVEAVGNSVILSTGDAQGNCDVSGVGNSIVFSIGGAQGYCDVEGAGSFYPVDGNTNGWINEEYIKKFKNLRESFLQNLFKPYEYKFRDIEFRDTEIKVTSPSTITEEDSDEENAEIVALHF